MGISFAAEFCYFPPARTGSHSVHSVLLSRFGKDYTPFGQSDLLARVADQHKHGYFELNGDHTRATMIHRLAPETRQFRSVATFREPMSRVASIYSYTCDVLGSTSSMESFDEWVRLVFCNRYNSMGRAHGLQTDVIFDDYGLPCVDRVYTIDRIGELLDFLVPGSGLDAPRINQSSVTYPVADLKLSTQRILQNFISQDLEFWDAIRAADGLIYATGR